MTKEEIEKKRAQERQVVHEIIAMYCRHHHEDRGEDGFCAECRDLAAYADLRLERCPRMAEKTFCSACPIHCYKPEMREKIRTVMRYGGPRMLLYHPMMTLRHMFLTWKAEKNGKLGKTGQGRTV